MNCSDHSAQIYESQWIDRRFSGVTALKRGRVCDECLEELEADEFVELVYVSRFAD
jgi:hypothetical protein